MGRRPVLNCFRVLFLVGLFCLMMSAASYPAIRVEFQLDAVLTRAEHEDPRVHAETRDLLMKSGRYEFVVWGVVGVLNCCVSLAGLYSRALNDGLPSPKG